MRVVIVNWTDTLDLSDINIVLNEDGEDGTPQIFDTMREAREYAMNNLNGRSETLNIDHD